MHHHRFPHVPAVVTTSGQPPRCCWELRIFQEFDPLSNSHARIVCRNGMKVIPPCTTKSHQLLSRMKHQHVTPSLLIPTCPWHCPSSGSSSNPIVSRHRGWRSSGSTGGLVLLDGWWSGQIRYRYREDQLTGVPYVFLHWVATPKKIQPGTNVFQGRS